jgi:SHS2 domain-containing protein
MGFEEIQHTADWAMRVWAEDLPSLFAECARGMNALAGVKLASQNRVKRQYMSEAPDAESLLVAFLSELLYYQEQESLAFDKFKIDTNGQHLEVNLEGAEIASMDKAIKAVTYHNLKIRKKARGLEVEIVLDV